jgi:hypothetical protein
MLIARESVSRVATTAVLPPTSSGAYGARGEVGTP